ncbi:MAG TPA: alanine--tRNA ligase [Candidatus Thermoplasmatota archaeon]|nr:alanine--tRNA ligase [Candidatus Thermoplasmatota archaeon]
MTVSGLDKEYQLEFFRRNGFARKTCASCKYPFWSQDAARTLCGDPPCAEYDFLGRPATKRRYTLSEMRETYLSFLEKRGHARVPPYGVVARWRDDIYLTIASIAVFQPQVTDGSAKPPANPLAISQPCIRLNDLDSVGKSGRHLTTFEMMAHHAFNSPQKEIYWKDRTVELCHEFLTRELGIDGKEVAYKEKPWAGGGNAGPAFEVLVRGLEVATLVFMNLAADPDGPIELYGERYAPMDLRVVDTGYGLERLAWISNGAPTIYEALWPELVRELTVAAGLERTLSDPRLAQIRTESARLASMVEVDTHGKLRELRRRVVQRLGERGVRTTVEEMEQVLAPLERIYAIADHTRCLAFLLGDGVVPSNSKAGYLARLVLRRTLRMIDEAKLPLSLAAIVDRQIAALAKDFPRLKAAREDVLDLVRHETERYREAMEKGGKLVEREARTGGLTPTRLVELYDSHGLPPDLVASVAARHGVAVEVPDDFYANVAQRHAAERKPKAKAAVDKAVAALPKTRLLFYETQETKEFDAVVLHVKSGTAGAPDEVVLDRTAFFAETGGQPADGGVLFEGGESVEVVDAQIRDGVVFHAIRGGRLKRGAMVKGRLDWGKRMAHLRHHTATHILLAAAKRVLGPHVWQTGAQKGYEQSRLDVTHHRRITDEEIRQIEQLANVVVLEDMAVERMWIDRMEAERRFGLQIYQGGHAVGGTLRVVRINDYDVECCGGTHARSTSEVGPIKILRAERIADGVERLVFSAGLAAVRRIQERDGILRESAEVLAAKPEELPKAIARLSEESRALRKELETLRKENARLLAAGPGTATAGGGDVGGVRVIVLPKAAERLTDLVAQARNFTGQGSCVAILGSADGGLVLAATPSLGLDLRPISGDVFAALGGKGGGKEDFLQGKGDPAKVEGAAQKARALVEPLLAKR